MKIEFKFVEAVPENLKEGILYISTFYKTTSHKCFCGCGNLVVAPILPARWTLIFDGDTVSLHPSIGNWSLPCQSHYLIRKSRVIGAEKWSKAKIAEGKRHDKATLQEYFEESDSEIVAGLPQKTGIFSRIVKWLFD